MTTPLTETDAGRLARWLDDHDLPGGGTPLTIEPLVGKGASNEILMLERGGERMVLRRPPPNPRPDSAKVLMREARLLAALRATDVPHARLLAACDDPSVLGTVFFVMDPVEGFSPMGLLPPPFGTDPAVRRAMGFALVDGIATLARVDHEAVGLEGFGKPDGFLDRQVDRWLGHLDSYSSIDGWDGRQIPGLEETAAWLRTTRPADHAVGILHGDYQFANVMFAPDRPELAAIIDWELSTIGDPMLDLGWVLATWSDPGERSATAYVEPWDAFPSRAELIERYCARTGRDPASAHWFRVLACFKLGILLEGHHARSVAGLSDAEQGRIMGDYVVSLFAQARELIA